MRWLCEIETAKFCVFADCWLDFGCAFRLDQIMALLFCEEQLDRVDFEFLLCG